MGIVAFFGRGAASSFSISLSASGDDVYFVNEPPSSSPTSRNLTSTTISCSVFGPPDTPSYSWSRVSGSAGIIANSPSSASTSFTGTVPINSTISAVFRLTVTAGSETRTADVTITMTYVSGL